MASLKYYDILIKPLVTEKAMSFMGEKKYAFLVHPDANKAQIREAVEKMFAGSKVIKVNTINQVGKPKRRGRVLGYTPNRKKAYVWLSQDSKDIELFSGL